MAKITAVIDIGSNSARMAVFERTSRFGFHLIKEVKSRVRISEDCYENNGYLQPKAIARAQKAVKEFVAIAKALKANKILCVATSATRDAPNRSEFISLIKKETGIAIKVIDGHKEAFYGAVAALNLLHIEEGLTVDVGGGSTECALIKEGKIVDLFSLNIGTIRLKELYFDKKAPMSEPINLLKEEMAKLHENIDTTTLIGIGGTARALAKSIMKKEKYPIDSIHGYEFPTDDNLDTIVKIASSEVLKLKKYGIKDDRLDTIRGGALIFAEIIKKYNIQKVVCSGVGVREGVFLSDVLRNCNHKFPNNFNPSIKSITDRFETNEKLSIVNTKLALGIFDALKPKHGIDDKYKYHLKIACRLSSIGISLNYYDKHKHGSYFLENALNYGFKHRDRSIISLLVKYHHKKVPTNADISDIKSLMPDISLLQWLSFILSLAECVNASYNAEDAEFEYDNNTLYVYTQEELYIAKEYLKTLAKPVPLAVIFRRKEG